MMGMQRPRTVPLKHERIADALAADIQAGTFAADEPLPSEAALGRRFAASRNTVRQALAALTEQGLIMTRPGVGSFVTFHPVDAEPALGWASAIQQKGAVGHVRTLSIREVAAAELPTGLLGSIVAPAERLLRIERVRQVVGARTISLERSLVPAVAELDGLPEQGLVDDSIIATLREAGLVAASGEQWVDVGTLGERDAQLFERTAGSSVLVSRCVTRAVDGTLVEYAESLMDPDYFRLHLTF
ncbi:GntR family transcriptional regulator [Pseudoclavibacter sp. CFCC 13796]|nr:GntR family transcriptional regulator [Pseudoclavibacter sp. CFCC 13796]